MSTKSSVDLRAELAELVKRKAEIAVSIDNRQNLTDTIVAKSVIENFDFHSLYIFFEISLIRSINSQRLDETPERIR